MLTFVFLDLSLSLSLSLSLYFILCPLPNTHLLSLLHLFKTPFVLASSPSPLFTCPFIYIFLIPSDFRRNHRPKIISILLQKSSATAIITFLLYRPPCNYGKRRWTYIFDIHSLIFTHGHLYFPYS